MSSIDLDSPKAKVFGWTVLTLLWTVLFVCLPLIAEQPIDVYSYFLGIFLGLFTALLWAITLHAWVNDVTVKF